MSKNSRRFFRKAIALLRKIKDMKEGDEMIWTQRDQYRLER